MTRFADRTAAGTELAAALSRYHGRPVWVVGLARGGVVVGAAVARALGAPLEVLCVRKLGAPLEPDLALGAVAEGGAVHLARGIVERLGVSPEDLDAILERERAEVDRKAEVYRGERSLAELRGKLVIVVDDGIATGSTARAALRALRALDPAQIILAAPVIASSVASALEAEVDDLVCLSRPRELRSVAACYETFEPVPDSAIQAALARPADPA